MNATPENTDPAEFVDPDLNQASRLDIALARAGEDASIFGSPLRAFTGRTMLVAQSIGLRLFSLSQAQLERLSLDDEASMYDGLLLDAATVTWLRLQDNKNLVRATLNRQWALEQVLAWAEKNEISITTETGRQMLESFVESVNTIAESSASEGAVTEKK